MSAATAGSTPSGSGDGRGLRHDRRLGHRPDRAVRQDGLAVRSARTVAPSGIRWRNDGESGHAHGRPARHAAADPARHEPRQRDGLTDTQRASRPARPPRRRRRPRGPSRSASGAASRRRGRAGPSGRRPTRGIRTRTSPARGSASVELLDRDRLRRALGGRRHGSSVIVSAAPASLGRDGPARTGRRPATTSRRRRAASTSGVRRRSRRRPRRRASRATAIAIAAGDGPQIVDRRVERAGLASRSSVTAAGERPGGEQEHPVGDASAPRPRSPRGRGPGR